ncbi:MAG: hypothetical protein ACJ8AI_23735 [Rhodopila sp.]
MRATAAERLTTVVGTSRDPLEIVLAIAADETQDTATRLGACSIVLPFIYPKLSATQVAATTTNINVDAGQLLDRLDERIAKLQPGNVPQLIEVAPDDEASDGAGGEAAPDEAT